MSNNISMYDVLQSFGFQVNPFKRQLLKTADMVRLQKIVRMAVMDRGMICIVGERGSGKSVAVISALEKINAKIVKTWAVDKRRLLISDIEYALLHELTDEPPKRLKEVRSLQLRRVLGESADSNVTLVIEEAHTLHGQTLRALKALRELAWAGKQGLFSTILIGQSDCMNKAGLSEVRLRSDTIRMGGLTPLECTEYTRRTLGHIVNAEALKVLEKMPGAKNYLDLQNVLIRAMAQAMIAGRQKVTAEDMEAIRGMPAPKEPPKPQAKPANTGGLKSVLARHQAQENQSKKEAV